MKRDIECEKEEIIRRMEEIIDPKLQKMLDSIAEAREPRPRIKLIMSMKGTSNASTK